MFKNLFSKKKEIKQQDVVYDLLKDARDNHKGTCVALTGAWGVGKTYRWEHNIKECFRKNEVIYISGFGKTELSEFKLELLDKLIKSKSLIVKFGTWFLCAAISTIIIAGVLSGVFQFKDIISCEKGVLIILKAIAIIALLCAVFYTPLVKYFSNKILGVDHNNIDFKRIWRISKKPILCFDDLERIATEDWACSVLGFIEELKNVGYPILLMLNPETKNSKEKCSESWEEFKEKVVVRTFEQLPEKETFESVIGKKEYEKLDETEKEYIKWIFDSWAKIHKDTEQWKEDDWDILFRIKSNFRMLEAIIKNIIFVKDKVKDYDKLDKNIKMSLLSYIGLYTVIKRLEIKSDRIGEKEVLFVGFLSKNTTEEEKEIQYSYNCVEFRTKEAKRFGNMVVLQEPISFKELVPIKKLLDTGCIEKNIVFEKISSRTEQRASSFYPRFSRTPDIQEFVDDLKETILNDEEPFSSINSMGNVLIKLCDCYEFLGKEFKEEDFKWFLPIMDKQVQQKKTSLVGIVHGDELIFSAANKDRSYSDNARSYLNRVFKACVVNNAVKQMQKSETFFDDYILSFKEMRVDSAAYLYVLSLDKNKQKELSDMKSTDYKNYLYIMECLTINVKNIDKKAEQIVAGREQGFVSELKEILKKEIISITKLPKAGMMEQYRSDELLKQLGD